MDGCEEVPGCCLVARRDRSKLLQLGEEVLDEVACLVDVLVIGASDLPVGLGRDDGRFAGSGERFDDALVRIVCLVGDEGLGLHGGDQLIRPSQIMNFATRQKQTDRVAQSIHQGVDLGAQATPRATDRLIFSDFVWAPALC